MFVLKHYRSNSTCPSNENNVSAVQKGKKLKRKKTSCRMQQLQVSTDFMCSTNFKGDKLLLTKSVFAEKYIATLSLMRDVIYPLVKLRDN